MDLANTIDITSAPGANGTTPSSSPTISGPAFDDRFRDELSQALAVAGTAAPAAPVPGAPVEADGTTAPEGTDAVGAATTVVDELAPTGSTPADTVAADTVTTDDATPDTTTSDTGTTDTGTTVASADTTSSAAEAATQAAGAQAAADATAADVRPLDPARVTVARRGVDTSALHPTTSALMTAASAQSAAADAPTETSSSEPSGDTTSESADDSATPAGDRRTMAGPAPTSTPAVTGAGTEVVAPGATGSGMFQTDKVRYLRDLAPAREIQRLAIDLDDAQIAVRFGQGAATVDVVNDPSSRLDGGWVHSVERSLRRLENPVEQAGTRHGGGEDNRQHDSASNGHGQESTDRRDRQGRRGAGASELDEIAVRRWQDATRTLTARS